MKFDIYWSETLFQSANKSLKSTSRGSIIASYISQTNFIANVEKTFDTTLDEEEWAGKNLLPSGSIDVTDRDDEDAEEEEVVADNIIDFWGSGLAPSFYLELERRLKYWCGGRDRNAFDVAEVAIIKQICLLEVTINRDSAAGKPIEKSVNALNALLGSANMKPIQKKAADAKDAMEAIPFGEWIRRWENTEPVPEPDPELRDVDGIVRYISTWFLGHLCKMLGIKNTYCKLYEDEIAKMRVDRPEFEEDDDETLFNDIFGQTEDDS